MSSEPAEATHVLQVYRGRVKWYNKSRRFGVLVAEARHKADAVSEDVSRCMSDVALECPFEVFMGSHAIDANSCVPHAGDNVEFQVAFKDQECGKSHEALNVRTARVHSDDGMLAEGDACEQDFARVSNDPSSQDNDSVFDSVECLRELREFLLRGSQGVTMPSDCQALWQSLVRRSSRQQAWELVERFAREEMCYPEKVSERAEQLYIFFRAAAEASRGTGLSRRQMSRLNEIAEFIRVTCDMECTRSFGEGASARQGQAGLVWPSRRPTASVMQVLAQRTRHIVLALENVRNLSNLGMIFRCMDAFGVQEAWVLNHRVSGSSDSDRLFKLRTDGNIEKAARGCEKYLTLRRFASVEALRQAAQAEQRQLWVSSLTPQSRSFDAVARALVSRARAARAGGAAGAAEAVVCDGRGDDGHDHWGPSGPSVSQLPRLCMVMGCESAGASREMRAVADLELYVPMVGFCESLNVAMCAAVLLGKTFDLARRCAEELRGNHEPLPSNLWPLTHQEAEEVCSTWRERGLLGDGSPRDHAETQCSLSWSDDGSICDRNANNSE